MQYSLEVSTSSNDKSDVDNVSRIVFHPSRKAQLLSLTPLGSYDSVHAIGSLPFIALTFNTFT